jgi:hypothetical protein
MLKKELGMSVAEDIGVFLNLANPKGVYNWDKDQDNHGTRPSWNAIVRMLQSGATVESLFGVEYRRPTVETESEMTSDAWKDPKFLEGFTRAYDEMKSKGFIK